MHTLTHRLTRASAIAALLVAAACGKKDAPPPAEAPPAPPPPAPVVFSVASIDLGKAIDASGRVTAPATTFAVRDTIYASVNTVGTATAANIEARWTFVNTAGKVVVVNTTSQTISPTGPVATEFHISKASAWPTGTYKVEILLNGSSAGRAEFTIQ